MPRPGRRLKGRLCHRMLMVNSLASNQIMSVRFAPVALVPCGVMVTHLTLVQALEVRVLSRQMTDYTDLLDFINKSSKDKNICNRLYGIRRVNGVIEGRILPEYNEVYWLPKHQLCPYHEKLIDKWFALNPE